MDGSHRIEEEEGVFNVVRLHDVNSENAEQDRIG